MSEILLDTNIFARYLVGDIPSQNNKAKVIFQSIFNGKDKGLVSILVIDELIWVCENYYGYKREEYLPKIIKLFSFRNIQVVETKKEIIMEIFKLMQKSNIDFTDYYLIKISKSRKIYSFDRDLSKLLKNKK